MPKHFITLMHLKQHEEYSCVPACVQMVLEHYGDRRTEEELITLLRCTPFGTTAKDVRRVAQLGYEVDVTYSTFEELQSYLAAGQPIIAFLRTGPLEYWSFDAPHAVVAIGYDEQVVYIDDPYFDTVPQRTSIALFKQAWWKSKNRMAVIRPKVEHRNEEE